MNPEVKRRWIVWSAQFEGRVAWLYLDIKGLVTVGVGNLVDPVEYAVVLPFRRKSDNNHAMADEIRADWRRIKGRAELASQGYRAAGRVAQLYLDDAAIDELVLAKLAANEATLARQFPDLSSWPWQAQMALHSVAWARGPNGFQRSYPRLSEALKAKDWAVAAVECKIGGEATNPGLKPRNEANRKLFLDAASEGRTQISDSPAPTRKGGLEALIDMLLAWVGVKR